jgi:CRISPR-associated RAMP protein (TIGR02581 family)
VFKQLLNEAILDLSLEPVGPILIKSGESGGLDPTHPDMEFVRTNNQVLIPGSSLKGVVRAHAERIVRSLQPQVAPGRGACDPLRRDTSCGDRIDSMEKRQRLNVPADRKYAESCAICRLFGSTVVASRVRFADALPFGEPPAIEERNGVAIDRVYGSVAVGPFNYEVVTRGVFVTRLMFRNVTLAQLALVGLALRDLGEGRVGLGFGKSRGLGRVKLDWGRLELRYPLAAYKRPMPPADQLLGVGELYRPEPQISYGFPAGDRVPLPNGLRFAEDDWGTLHMVAEGAEQVQAVFRATIERWRAEVAHA